MRFWRFGIAAGLCAALIVSVGSASAKTLGPYEVYDLRKSAVVFFHSKDKGDDMGFGVLVSREGHVLTANHVIRDFGKEAVRATIGSKDGPLLEFDPNVSSELELGVLDLRLLRLANPPDDLKPAPIGRADHFKPATTQVHILTGFIDQKNSSPLNATVLSQIDKQSDFWRMQGAGVDRGHSGSPAFDQFGDVVGFIPSGIPSSGIFNLRTFDLATDWLKTQHVPYEQRVRSDKIGVYVRAVGYEEQRGQFKGKLSSLIEELLGLQIVESDTEPPFIRDLEVRAESPNEKLLNDAVNELGTEWVAQQDALKLYLYVVQLQFTGSNRPTSAIQFVVMLERDGNKIRAKQWRLNSARFFKRRSDQDIDADAEDGLLTENSFTLLKSAAETRGTPFRDNGLIFAECLDTTEIPPQLAEKIEWKANAAQRLKYELRKMWYNHESYRRYRVESGVSSICTGLRIREDLRQQYRHHREIAQLIIESSVKSIFGAEALSVQWKIRQIRPPDELSNPKPLRVNLTGEDFAAGLARMISQDWADMLKQLKP
jgi:hypothetical protein